MSPDYRYQQHAAGIAIEARGRTFEQVCEQAAIALFGLMAHPSTLLPERQVVVEFDAVDPVADARVWLERLLAQAEFRGLVFCAASIERVGERWRGEAWGMSWRPGGGRVPLASAISRDGFTLEAQDGAWRLSFIARFEAVPTASDG